MTAGDPVAVGEPAPPARRRTVRAAALAAGALLVVAAATVVSLAWHTSGAPAPASGAVPTVAVPVTRQTLTDTRVEPGILGYGRAVPVVGQATGIITALPEVGAIISRGQPLYAVDDRPTTLLYGHLPAFRALAAGLTGADVREFEQNLAALGYGGFTVDDSYTAATATAVKHWQHDLGVPESGTVDLGRVVFEPGSVRVTALTGLSGGPAAAGQAILSVTGTTRQVTVDLDPADQDLARRGAHVDVALPDGSTVAGTVAGEVTVVQPAAGGGDPATKVEVTVSLAGTAAQRAVAGFDDATVQVTFVAAVRPNVLTVPVAALVALAEGGYGVQIIDGARTRYVAVQTGLYAGGRVEISGAGIVAGTLVGVPS